MNKIASVLLCDVGEGMERYSPDADQSEFNRMKACISKIILNKIFAGDSDEVGIVAFGSEQTNNNLARNDSTRYHNINVIHSLQIPTIDMFNKFDKVSLSSCGISDWVQGLVVALDFMRESTVGKRFKSKQILLFSNFSSELNYKQDIFNTIATCFEADSIKLIIVGEDLSDAPEGGFTSNLADLSSLYIRLEDSVSLTTPELADSIKYFEKKRSAGRVNGVLLDIGTNVRIPVGWLKLTKDQQRISNWVPFAGKKESSIIKKDEPSSSLNMSGVETISNQENDQKSSQILLRATGVNEDIDIPISMETDVKKSSQIRLETTKAEEDGDDSPVSMRTVIIPDIQKVARFGSTRVILSYAELESLKRNTGPPVLSIFMFTKKHNINPIMFVGKDVYGVVPKPGNKHSQAMLAALIDAMEKTNKVAIAKRIATRNGKVQIGALLPFSDEKGKHMFFMKLPTAEWVQAYPRFREVSFERSEEKVNLINDLIDKLTLPTDLVEDGKGVLIRNPNFQLRCHILSERLLDENSDPTAEPPDFIRNLMNLNSDLKDQAQPVIQAILEKFPDLDPSLRIAQKKRFKANLKKYNNTEGSKPIHKDTPGASNAENPVDDDEEDSMSKYFTDDLSDEEMQNTDSLLFK